MKEKFEGFYNFIANQGIEISDKSNPYQCMDLCYAWVFYLNFPKATVQHLYASEVYTGATDLTRQYFDLIPNTPEVIPQIGDIVVFNRTDVNVAGHVSIANGVGDANSFISFDQNWNGKLFTALISHNYNNPKVLGFLRPKIQAVNPVINDQTKINIGGEFGIMEVQAIRSSLTEQVNQKKTIENLNTTLVNLDKEFSDYKNNVNKATDKAILMTITENDIKWQSKLETANATIQALSSQELSKIPYQTLLSWAIKNFFTRKKG